MKRFGGRRHWRGTANLMGYLCLASVLRASTADHRVRAESLTGKNVVFFPVPELAERMGFRACLRCRPNQHISDDPQVEMVRRICRYIGESPNGSPTLEELGANVNVSPSHLQRVFKRIMSITPRQYADAQRLSDLKTRLREGWSVTDAMYEAGYGSSSRLYEKASAQLGMTPSAYRRRGQHSQIAYAVVDCPLGQLLIAATERGICAVSLGDDGTSLEAELRREYPGAEFYYDHATLKEWVELILRHLSGKLPSLRLAPGYTGHRLPAARLGAAQEYPLWGLPVHTARLPKK